MGIFFKLKKMGKIIGIVSLKGGVGKTSVVASLGDAMAHFGKKSLLVDGNLSAPNLGLHFNIVEPEITLHHVLARKAGPKDAIHNLERFDVMPASIFNKLDVSPLKLGDKIGYLRKFYDAVIIDSSPALNDETLGVMLASDEILVVTTPDHPTLSNTIKAVKLAVSRGTPISGIILNKVHDKDFEVSVKEVEDTLDLPVMAVIPYDINVLKALSEFKSFPSYRPWSRASEEYKRLAATLIGEKYGDSGFKRFFGWINPKVQDVNRAIYYNEVFGK